MVALLAVDLAFFAGVVLKQHIVVSPNEPNIQIPYIQRHMDATLAGYRLDDDRDGGLAASPDRKLTAAEIDASETVKNAPILPSWVSRIEEPPDVQHLRRITLSDDLTVYGPMLDIFKQEQSLRPYYDVINVDGVRYDVDGRKQMFVSAARELPSLAFLGPKEWLRYWGSAALMYTHGYGLVMSPVNRVDDEGRPVYAVRDIPPKAEYPQFATPEPRIYYGEGMKDDYILTNIRHLKELDYPDDQFRVTGEFSAGRCRRHPRRRRLEAGDLRAPHEGSHGIPVFVVHRSQPDASSPVPHAHAARGAARAVPLRREQQPRVRRRQPDSVDGERADDDGHVSVRLARGARRQGRRACGRSSTPSALVNYGEDSVKITMDAFSGEIHFYKMTDDPIITRLGSSAFPGLFEPRRAMPEPVRAQLNYPLQWFHVQFDDIYKRYHMRDPLEFYNVEDLWDDADEALGSLGRGLEEYGTPTR